MVPFPHSSIYLRLRLRRAVRALLLLPCVGWGLLSASGAYAQRTAPTLDVLEESVEALVPKQKRSEQDEDRLLAGVQFSFARMLAQREEYALSLRHYERAFRNDPTPIIAREIVRMAGQLDRHAEAVRYAVLGAEIQPPAGTLPIQLANLLSERGETDRATKLLERAVQSLGAKPTGLTAVLLHLEWMRLSLASNQAQNATAAADYVRAALQATGDSSLSPAELQGLGSQTDKIQSLIAESYLASQRFDEAEAALQAAHAAKPDNAMLSFGRARIAAAKKDWQLARQHVNEYVQARGTAAGFEAYQLLEQAITSQTEDQAAARTELITALEKFRQQDPQNDALAYFTAAKLLAAEQWDRAAALYEQLLKSRPTSSAYRELASIYRSQKDLPKLLSLLQRGLQQSAASEVFGEEWARVVKDDALAGQLLTLAAKSDPNRRTFEGAWSHVAGACLAIDRGEVETARKLYSQALQASPGEREKIRDTIGVAALLAERNPLAIDIFSEALATESAPPKQARYHFYLAGALEFSGQTDAALDSAEKCATLQPASPQLQARPAWVLYHAERWDEAERRYEQVLEKFDSQYDSESTRDQLREIRLILSNICVQQERLPEAEEWLEQVLDEFPEDVGALNDLGYLWADQGKRLQRALRMVEQAVQEDSDNQAYRDSLGWAYFRLGRYQDAVRELELAAAGQDAVVLGHLGDAYAKLPDRERALQAWQKALEQLPATGDAKQRSALEAKIRALQEAASPPTNKKSQGSDS